MIKEIIKDNFFLAQKSKEATKEDMSIVQDMLDTLHAHHEHCVGIAANMIGIQKRIIVIKDQDNDLIMVNPKIIKVSGRIYQAQEGCLCHEGTKETKRYEKIKVKYMDMNWKVKIKSYEGMIAQIIQHELDHCEGILI